MNFTTKEPEYKIGLECVHTGFPKSVCFVGEQLAEVKKKKHQNYRSLDWNKRQVLKSKPIGFPNKHCISPQ